MFNFSLLYIHLINCPKQDQIPLKICCTQYFTSKTAKSKWNKIYFGQVEDENWRVAKNSNIPSLLSLDGSLKDFTLKLLRHGLLIIKIVKKDP